MIIAITLAVIFIVIIVLVKANRLITSDIPKMQASLTEKLFGHLGKFDTSNCHLSITRSLSFAIDLTKSVIHFRDTQNKYYTYTLNQLLQSEILIDGIADRRVSASGAAGRADVGGLLTGNMGNVVGNVQSKSELEHEVERIDLKLIIDDSNNPVFAINFMITPQKKGEETYKSYYADALHWHEVFAKIVMENHHNISQEVDTSVKSAPTDTAIVNTEISILGEDTKPAVISSARQSLSADDKSAEWVTIEKYCKLFGISDTTTVSGWITRGIVPPENLRIIEELNELQLIKAVPYEAG